MWSANSKNGEEGARQMPKRSDAIDQGSVSYYGGELLWPDLPVFGSKVSSSEEREGGAHRRQHGARI